jgi:hypothetical protein
MESCSFVVDCVLYILLCTVLVYCRLSGSGECGEKVSNWEISTARFPSFPSSPPTPLQMEQYSPPKGGPSSPAASREPRLHLPSTTDPPGPQNPPKPLVWLVSASHLPTLQLMRNHQPNIFNSSNN